MCGCVLNCRFYAAAVTREQLLFNDWTPTRVSALTRRDVREVETLEVTSERQKPLDTKTLSRSGGRTWTEWGDDGRKKKKRQRKRSANQQRDAKTKFSSKARSSALFRHNDPLKLILRGRVWLMDQPANIGRYWFIIVTCMLVGFYYRLISFFY